MASLRVFSKRIKQVGKDIETNASLIVRKVALAVNAAVVIATPVDTGQARANWQLQIGTPASAPLKSTDIGGTLARNKAVAQTRRQGQDIYISNVLDYIGVLNEGSSSQAPPNFVSFAVRQGIIAVKNSKLVN